MKLSHSVGLKGINKKADVKLVQEALNRVTIGPLRLLSVDGLCGANTRQRVYWFQKEVLKFRRPDSLIDVKGKTWKALSLFLVKPKEQAKSFASLFSTSHKQVVEKVEPSIQSIQTIAWGAKVSPEFKHKVLLVCKELGINPDFLMACMAFETGETFSPKIKNAAGSGATGLIQFMPATAKGLGTTTEKLAQMTAVKQLDGLMAALIGGMVIAAIAKKSFEFRPSAIKHYMRHLAAGILMGLGAVMAGGGNDSQLLVALPALSSAGIVAVMSIIAGIFVGVRAGK
ncbi:hypothetical protein DSB67_04295 [Vibrio campbellii]|uniref:YeeE/YedE thiosulfate transporter family protein n=1 Tax=Vibrio campbellii TaxID=680 RepID=UPI00026C4DB8|nr:YeeE/YedE thiosulfate transporter family protein [Vibrio campbellii]AXB30838.1 hypothetical protein DSB67_04295 [Vibrio campbellii]